MIYQTKTHVVIEVFSESDAVRQKLKDSGFTFTEEDFLNDFWGTRFTVEKPRGKGAHARLNQLKGTR